MPGFGTGAPYNHPPPANNRRYVYMCGWTYLAHLPLNTLRNWGNSSRLVLRMNLPMRVARESLRVACFRSASLLARMLRNFRHRKVFITYPFATGQRIWVRGIPAKISSPSMGIIQDKINMITRELTTRSSARFLIRLPTSSNGSLRSERMGRSPKYSMLRRG